MPFVSYCIVKLFSVDTILCLFAQAGHTSACGFRSIEEGVGGREEGGGVLGLHREVVK